MVFPRISSMRNFVFVLTLTASSAAVDAASDIAVDPPIECESCEAWNAPRKPFRIFGNTYYVGTAGLSVILIKTEAGLVLLDGALPQSVPAIVANIQELDFRLKDVRLILNSHAHFDHAGGIAALQRASGASIVASQPGAEALVLGKPTQDDPQYALQDNHFPKVFHVRRVFNKETLSLGGVEITAHLTPGHTPGSTTWTWRSCEKKRCIDIVYADSLSVVSAPGFRYTADGTTPSRVDEFFKSIATIEALPCDVLLSPHPWSFSMDEKLERWRKEPDINPFIDKGSCAAYAAEAREKLKSRVVEENNQRPPGK